MDRPGRRLLLPALLIGALAAPLAAQTRTSVANSRYDITFDTTTAKTRSLNVAMTFAVSGPGPVVLSRPVWTPGTYEVTFFDRNVPTFAPSASGRALDWDKTSFS